MKTFVRNNIILEGCNMELVYFYKKNLQFLGLLLELDECPNIIFGKNKKIYYNSGKIKFEYQEVMQNFILQIMCFILI